MTTVNRQLKKKALALPLLPGVYLMKDKEGSIIYVGKSKHLKKRVSSYFSSNTSRPRKVERMVRQITDFDYQVTDTELDALLLECKLIKEIKPLYNKLLKNDSRYRYVHLNEEGAFPFWESTYEQEETGVYFGPYDMKYEIDTGLEAVSAYYGTAICKGRNNKSCCVARIRKQCLAPCMEQTKRYGIQIEKAMKFFRNEDETVILHYEQKMQQAAENLEFEKAQSYKEIAGILRRMTYRKKAIEWSLSGKKSIAIIPCAAGGFKVYFLLGAVIKRTLLIKKKRILSKWLTSFEEEVPVSKAMAKSDMDRAYIIYSYLHGNKECELIEIKGDKITKISEN